MNDGCVAGSRAPTGTTAAGSSHSLRARCAAVGTEHDNAPVEAGATSSFGRHRRHGVAGLGGLPAVLDLPTGHRL